MDEDFNLHVFKIDTKYKVKVIKIQSVKLNIKIHKLDKLHDFKFIEDKLVIYTDSRLGWESQIILNFFHFSDSITPVFNKRIKLDPSFSPDKKDTLFYRF